MEMVVDNDVHATSLRHILVTISAECHELSEFLDRFQHALSPALIRVAEEDECHRDIQSLDLLAQRLASLSGYVLEISSEIPEDMKIDSRDALANIPLAELQYRLKGTPLPQDSNHLSGELDLF